MKKQFYSAWVAVLFLLGISASVRAQDEVTMRYMASYGGISAHELAEALGYFKGTGVMPAAARSLYLHWPQAALISGRLPHRRLSTLSPTVTTLWRLIPPTVSTRPPNPSST